MSQTKKSHANTDTNRIRTHNNMGEVGGWRRESEGRGGIILLLSDILCVVLLRQVLRGMGTLSREANLSRNYFGLTSEKKSWEQILSC